MAHTDEIIDKYLEACEDVFEKIVAIHLLKQDISEYLEGPVCHAGFERLN